TYLKEIDNQNPDGINLEPLDLNSIYISDKIQSLELPSVYVLSGASAFQYSDNQNYMESEDEIIVVMTAEEIGADELTRKMWRYGRVLYQTLNLVDLGDLAGRIKIKIIPTRLGYTIPITEKLQKGEQRFRMDAVLELKVLHYENNLTN
ncbi:MAG: hypothetical protein ACEQSC_01800, partial [Candidatus Nanopelagicaceae bacterium]